MLIARCSLFFKNYFVLLQHKTIYVAKILIIYDMLMKKWNNYMLMACIAALLTICVMSICSPLQNKDTTDEPTSDTTSYHKDK